MGGMALEALVAAGSLAATAYGLDRLDQATRPAPKAPSPPTSATAQVVSPTR